MHGGMTLAKTSVPPESSWPEAPEGRALIAAFLARLFLVLLALACLTTTAQAGPDQDMRFPAPEFRSGYKFSETTVPSATSEAQQWLDVAERAGEEFGFTDVGRGFDVKIGVPLDKSLKKGLGHTAAQVIAACPAGALAHDEQPPQQ